MNNEADFRNKGFDLFIELSKLNPNKKFVLIGFNKFYFPWLESKYHVSQLANLKIIPSFCPDAILSEYFNKAKVYLQISITEGMPVSLGEAMLCECIPIGSNVNGIPDAIGETGILVYERNIKDLNNALQSAFTLNTGANARDQIIFNFSLFKREQKLSTLISKYI